MNGRLMKLVNIEDLKSSAEKLQSSSLWSSTNDRLERQA